MTLVLDKPEIGADIFERLTDCGGFCNAVRQYYRYVCNHSGYEPIINDGRLENAWQAFAHDKKHGGKSLPANSDGPDHFKLCGMLAFWLRRFAPVYGLDDRSSRRDAPQILIDMLKKYNSEFLAFEFGLEICHFFEKYRKGKKSGRPLVEGNGFDYYKAVCYMMKFKSTSPHSMGLIYRSLFIPVIPDKQPETE